MRYLPLWDRPTWLWFELRRRLLCRCSRTSKLSILRCDIGLIDSRLRLVWIVVFLQDLVHCHSEFCSHNTHPPLSLYASQPDSVQSARISESGQNLAKVNHLP